jgi:predicted  nucleic acid-binding Zn-ribbon protein
MFRFSLISSLNLFKTNFKMTSVSDLKMKSKQASELIESLKTQIARIKEESSPAFMVQKAKNLEKENTQLKFKVEELKKELEAAESLKGPSSK